jgi:hypothetical protein
VGLERASQQRHRCSEATAAVRIFAICLGADDGLAIANYQTVNFADASVTVRPGDGVVRQSVGCSNPSGRAIGGGAQLLRGKNAAIEIQESFPDTPASWTIAVTNRAPTNAGNATVRLYAICIAP